MNGFLRFGVRSFPATPVFLPALPATPAVHPEGVLVYPHGSRSTARPLLRLAVIAATSTLVTALFGAASPAVAATTLPITVTNSTGSGKPVYLYLLGTQLSSGKLGYVDTKGEVIWR